MDTQKKFERELEKLAEAQGFELVIDRFHTYGRDYGKYRIQWANSFTDVIRISFSWQDGEHILNCPDIKHYRDLDDMLNSVKEFLVTFKKNA